MFAIQTNQLTKSYGAARGIIDVNLKVEQGEIFGFIGPNGAGKSTTIRTLLSLIHKTSGSACIFGLDCETQSQEILQDVGYLPSEIFYYDNMKVMDLLNYSASFYKKDCTQKIKQLAQELELDLTRKIEDLSLGNKKKVGIVQGLCHSPKLIILDEPTSGLDPLMQKKFFDIIKRENEAGATVLFSSHILSEVQRICHRVGIIKEGRLIRVQSIDSLNEGAYKKVVLTHRTPLTKQLPDGVKDVVQQQGETTFLFGGDCNVLIDFLQGQNLLNVQIADPSLEEIFMHYYTD